MDQDVSTSQAQQILWTTLEKSTQTNKILVSTEGPNPLQETYNAANSNNRWGFGGTPCTSAGVSHNNTSCNNNGLCFCTEDIFDVESDPNGTAIKAKDSGRYLSLHIDGVGVPDSAPTFTSSAPSGSSTASIRVSIKLFLHSYIVCFSLKGSSVTLTKFERKDENGMTAFGFTISNDDPVNNFEYYTLFLDLTRLK
jgi:hypothetical protein